MQLVPHFCLPSPPPHSDDLIPLIRADYREMPCLSLTVAQAARLWNVDRGRCLDALETLASEGFLRRSRDMYVYAGRSPAAS